MNGKLLLSLLPSLGVFALVMWLGHSFYHRADLTRDGLYSLNEGSKTVIADVKSELQMRFYLSDDLPHQYQRAADFAMTLARAYAAESNGRITIITQNPEGNEALEMEAIQSGVEKTRVNVTRGNKLESLDLWFGLALAYEEQLEAFTALQAVTDFEYEVTSAIVRMTQTRKQKVLMVGPTYIEGKGTVFDINRNMRLVANFLGKHYDLDQQRIVQGQSLDLSGSDALVVWGLPYFSEAQLYQLDQYIVAGGQVLLLTSAVRVEPNMLLAQVLPKSRADGFYEHLGFRVMPQLVSDQQCTKIKYTNVKPPVYKDYPLFPKLTLAGGELSREHTSTKYLTSAVLPWTSHLEPVGAEGVKIKVIGQTSPQAWLQDGEIDINPATAPGPQSFDRYTLGLALEGRFRSFFNRPPSNVPEGTTHVTTGNKVGNLLVWGSEHVLTQTNQRTTIEWLNHAVGFLCHRNALGDIDRRENAVSPIRELKPEQQDAIRTLSVTLTPGLILLAAGIYWLRRRRRNVDVYLPEPSA